MSLSNGGVQATMPVAPVNSSNGGFGWGGEGSWFIIILFFSHFSVGEMAAGGTTAIPAAWSTAMC